jgi:hypothetical protein
VGLPPSAEAQREIVVLVGELEQLCAQAERQLMGLQWPDLNLTLADMRRVTQALVNVAHASAEERPEEFNKQFRRRMDRIYAIRGRQLERIVAYRDNVRGRLRVIAKAKQVRHSFGAYTRTGIGHLDSLR